ncbi:winged helix-turn-helix domain-containing protein [Flavilitoribacter nigricans]|nr:LysR family transcriptional regulator [Flavilitoribacter nigricans]
MSKRPHTEIRIRIYTEDEPFLGIGRIQLLENIIEHGSIAKGAAAMNMSYRKAWQLVEYMNAMAERPLVEKRLGGSKGGGAYVTETGQELIRKFHELRLSAEQFVAQKAKEIGL